MKIKKTVALLMVAAMFVAVLAACGDKQSGETANTTNPGSVTDTVITDQGTADDISSATKDVINVGIDADVSDFNPWSFSGTGANQALWGLYQPLLHHVDGQYYSGVAKSYEMADDGLSISFELYDYIHDWEGNHITSDDVLFSFEKCTEVFPEYSELIDEVVKTGDYTFSINFTRTLYVGDFDTFVRVYIVSKTAYENSADEMHTTPVGTGPYKLTQYTSGYMLTYEKVEDFWQTDKTQVYARDMANVETINYYILSESSQRAIALERGTIDICGSISNDDISKFDGQKGFKLAGVADNLSMNLFCNNDDSNICSDLNLRLAICYAVNSAAILESVYGGRGTVMYDHTPSWAVGYKQEWEEEDNYYQYDPEKAAEYLKNSTYNGETLRIICAADERSTNTAQLVMSFLGQIGIKTDVQSYETTVFSQYFQTVDMWDIMLYTRPINTYYVQGMYSSFATSRYASGGGVNFVFDDHLQELLNASVDANTATDEDIQALHDYMIANCYVMGLVNPINSIVVPDEVTSVTLSYRKTIIPGGCVYS